jgi:hypothetical protein
MIKEETMCALLLAMLLMVCGVSFAQPDNPVANPGFEQYEPDTRAPSGWYIPKDNHAKVRCASGSTPTDGCALVLRAGHKVTQWIEKDWSAGDQFILNVSYRTNGAYTAGVFKAQISEALHIGGSYVEAEEARRKIRLVPANTWATLTDDDAYNVMWDTYFNADTFSGRSLYIIVSIANRSAAGKLLVDEVGLAVVPADTP